MNREGSYSNEATNMSAQTAVLRLFRFKSHNLVAAHGLCQSDDDDESKPFSSGIIQTLTTKLFYIAWDFSGCKDGQDLCWSSFVGEAGST